MAVRRITVSLDDRDADRLEEVKQETKTSNESEVLRKALATEAFVQRTIETGGKLLVQDKTGQVREVEFLR